MGNVFIPPDDPARAPNAEMTTVIDTTTGDQWRVPRRAVEALRAALAGEPPETPETLRRDALRTVAGIVNQPGFGDAERLIALRAYLDAALAPQPAEAEHIHDFVRGMGVAPYCRDCGVEEPHAD